MVNAMPCPGCRCWIATEWDSYWGGGITLAIGHRARTAPQHTLMTAHIDDAHSLFQWLVDGVPIEPQRKVPASPILEHVDANEAFDETSASIDLHWRMSGSLGSR